MSPQKIFEILGLGNAISSVLQELFVIYAYRKLFTSYTVLGDQIMHIEESITLATSITK